MGRGERIRRDIDVNVFVGPDQAGAVFEARPGAVAWSVGDVETVRREDQVRLWWDDTPVDVFFAADPFHLAAAVRAREVEFSGRSIRVLAPVDLATFKVLFDRPKDWVDIANMIDSGTLEPRRGRRRGRRAARRRRRPARTAESAQTVAGLVSGAAK